MSESESWDLSGVSDQDLVRDLRGLLASGARAEAMAVAHLAEVEERRLHLKAAASSLFDYCLRRLRLSESEAFHRITAARLARKFPVIFGLLASRSIHLSALRVLRDHLTDENHRELLAAATGKSKKEVEALVAALAPRPDVAPLIRRLSVTRRALPSASIAGPVIALAPASNVPHSPPLAPPVASTSAPEESSPDSRDVVECALPSGNDPVAPGCSSSCAELPLNQSPREHVPNMALHPNPTAQGQWPRPDVPAPVQRTATRPRTRALEPLSAARYLLRVSVSQKVAEKLERARDLMSHANPSGDLSTVIERALDSLLDNLEKQRFAQTKCPRTARPSSLDRRSAPRTEAVSSVAPPARRAPREHIPNEIRRAVAKRDAFQCTYVDDDGMRCSSRAFLQLHHEQAHALGGLSTLENLRLLCGSHNRLLAEQDFGRTHQDYFIKCKAPSKPEPAVAQEP